MGARGDGPGDCLHVDVAQVGQGHAEGVQRPVEVTQPRPGAHPHLPEGAWWLRTPASPARLTAMSVGWPIALNECPEPSGRTVRPAAPARTSTSAAAAASTGTATCVGVDVTVPDQLRHHPARGAPHHRP